MKKIQRVADSDAQSDVDSNPSMPVDVDLLQDIKIADAEMMPVVVAPQRVVEKAGAKKIPSRDVWEEIRNLQIEMFCLPPQSVEYYTSVVSHNDTMAILSYKVPSMIASLESLIGNKFTVEPKEKYLVVTRK
jgi:hypothetical protein